MSEENTLALAHPNRNELQREISATTSSLENLHAKLVDLRSALNETSPILSILPMDVLIEVFSISIQRGPGAMGSLPQQFVLGAVCRSWRNIIWKTTSFWKKLEILVRTNPKGEATQRRLIQEWIRRSGSHLLDLRLVNSHSQEPVEVYCLLLSHSTRWASLSLIGQPFENLRDMLVNRELKFPMLSDLRFVTNAKSRHGGQNRPWMFNTCPQLRRVELCGQSLSSYTLDWAIIEEMDVSFNDKGALKALANAASSIKKASFHFFSDSVPRSIAHALLLPFLSDLQLRVDTRSDGHLSIFCGIEAPALQRLKLVTYGNNAADFPPHLIAMIKRSRCHLKTLELDLQGTETIFEHDIVNILNATPSLETFSLESFSEQLHLSNTMFEFMDPSDISWREEGVGSFLPCLTRFIYKGHANFELTSLQSALETRMHFASTCNKDNSKAAISKLELVHISCANKSWVDMQDGHSAAKSFSTKLKGSFSQRGLELKLFWGSSL